MVMKKIMKVETLRGNVDDIKRLMSFWKEEMTSRRSQKLRLKYRN